MSYESTDKHLKVSLLEKGFHPYPSHSNKYYNQDGQIVWTDGEWFKDEDSGFVKKSTGEWMRYDRSQ